MDQEYIMKQLEEFFKSGTVGQFIVERKPNNDIFLLRNTSEKISCTKDGRSGKQHQEIRELLKLNK